MGVGRWKCPLCKPAVVRQAAGRSHPNPTAPRPSGSVEAAAIASVWAAARAIRSVLPWRLSCPQAFTPVAPCPPRCLATRILHSPLHEFGLTIECRAHVSHVHGDAPLYHAGRALGPQRPPSGSILILCRGLCRGRGLVRPHVPLWPSIIASARGFGRPSASGDVWKRGRRSGRPRGASGVGRGHRYTRRNVGLSLHELAGGGGVCQRTSSDKLCSTAITGEGASVSGIVNCAVAARSDWQPHARERYSFVCICRSVNWA